MYQLTGPGPTQTTNQRVHQAVLSGLQGQKAAHVDVITAAEGSISGGWAPLDLDSDDVRALLKAAAAIVGQDDDADPDSAPYRVALSRAQAAVTALAESELMRSASAGKPARPHYEDVGIVRQASAALHDLVTEHDRYWPTRNDDELNQTRRPAPSAQTGDQAHLQEGKALADLDAVWARITAHQGERFETKTGKPFTYRIDHGQLVPTHTNRKIPRSDVAKALALMPLDGPGQISNLVQGSAYVYGILSDPRIRPA